MIDLLKVIDILTMWQELETDRHWRLSGLDQNTFCIQLLTGIGTGEVKQIKHAYSRLMLENAVIPWDLLKADIKSMMRELEK